jgi:regulatory protein
LPTRAPPPPQGPGSTSNAAPAAPSGFDFALKLLARKARTARELDAALARKAVPREEREAVLARLSELGYMDDREVARGRARVLLERGEAPRLAERRLSAQGVEREIAKAAVAQVQGAISEDELLARALRRRLHGRAPRDENERRRVFRALIAKGHKPSAVARALRVDWNGDDDAFED